MICKTAGYLFAILTLVTIFACKNDNLKKDNKESSNQLENNNVEKPIDTSYKKNLRLFDQFYYDMPEKVVVTVNAEFEKKMKSNYAILTYKNENIYFKKQFLYEAGLLKSVKLVANNITDKRENSPLILELFNSKYGRSTIEEDKFDSDEIQTVATRIIDYKKGSSFEPTTYDSKIHRKITNNELKEFLNNLFTGGFYSVANNDLQIVSSGGDTFYKVMKDVTKDEFVKIPVEVAIKKIPYKKILTYNNHTWKDGEKEIRLHFFKSLKYIGNKYDPIENGINTDLIVTFKKSQKSNKKNEKEDLDEPKLTEKETMNAI